MSIRVEDALGQGAGAGSSGATQGRAATFTFNTDLGPMNNAGGAGASVIGSNPPKLVRQGEVIITDASGNIVVAGYATKYTDTTTKQLGASVVPFTQIDGIDYSTSLQ